MISFKEDVEGWLRDVLVAPGKKLAFFVGAGISVDSGIPNFFNFARDFIGSICPSDFDKGYIDPTFRTLTS
jgi:hypothetical protein